MLDVQLSSMTRDSFGCFGNVFCLYVPFFRIEKLAKYLEMWNEILERHSLTTPCPHVINFIRHVELYTLPSDAQTGPSWGALLQSTGQDSRIALPFVHDPTCANVTAAVPTRHAWTRNMHRFKYVRPSDPHTRSLSLGHLCPQFDPFERSHPSLSSYFKRFLMIETNKQNARHKRQGKLP